MPDTVVPVVRRPVRRVSATPDPKELSSGLRKLSIGEESSRAPERLRTTWNRETGRRDGEVEVRRSTEKEVKKAEEVKRYVRRSSIDTKKEPSPSKGEEEKATSNKKKEEENLLIGEEQQQRRPVISSPHSGFPTGDKAKLPTLTVAKNRPIKTSKDLELERCVGKWLEMVAGKRGKDETFERWIQDGTVLAKAMVSVCFNSVPMEMVSCNWGASPVRDRIKCVIHEMRRFGVSEVFEVEDLMELKNVPKVCKAVARLCRLAAADSKNEDLRSVARGIPAFC